MIIDGVVKKFHMRRYSVWPDVRHTFVYAFTPGQTLCLAYGPFSIAIRRLLRVHHYLMFLEKLSDSLEVYNVSLLGYVCMTNHYHLLVTTPEGNLSSFMRHFNVAYTSSFNRRHKRSGHLFQGRYKSYLVDADSYLKEVSRYIHLNPVRIKAYSDMETDQRITILKKFRYSSFAGYTNTKKRDDFVHYQMVLDYFGGDTKEGRAVYWQFVYRGMNKGESSPARP